MAYLPESPSLADLQKYQKAICEERGWDEAAPTETFLLFTEEVGELAKAIRYQLRLFTESGKSLSPDALQDEFADVLGYLLELANVFEVDLSEAYQRKEEINQQRDWSGK